MQYTFDRTCHACPQQYDIYDNKGNQVAYARLRHGRFYVAAPDMGGDLILIGFPNGDGIFSTEEEEAFWLDQAVLALEHRRYAAVQWERIERTAARHNDSRKIDLNV